VLPFGAVVAAAASTSSVASLLVMLLLLLLLLLLLQQQYLLLPLLPSPSVVLPRCCFVSLVKATVSASLSQSVRCVAITVGTSAIATCAYSAAATAATNCCCSAVLPC
jgi:hypothetical protein